MSAPGMAAIAIVGAGPRGLGVLERLSANAVELAPGPLTVHLIDPFPPGAGRVWRADQSPLLWLNSAAQDVTFFTDESIVMDGPVRAGPTMAEWAAAPPDGLEPDVALEAATLGPHDFPTRRFGNAYLAGASSR